MGYCFDSSAVSSAEVIDSLVAYEKVVMNDEDLKTGAPVVFEVNIRLSRMGKRPECKFRRYCSVSLLSCYC